jgi:hypothetical protein
MTNIAAADPFTDDLDSAPAYSRAAFDFYPTPQSIIKVLLSRWHPMRGLVWEPCSGDGRFVEALRGAGIEVVHGDIQTGENFFTTSKAPAPVIVTNPPFQHIRKFIDHAFAIGVQEMALVGPERLWASRVGRCQFERHRPSVWANMDWREDYLNKGGSPDRALAVGIWGSPCAATCEFQVWPKPDEHPSLFY